MKKDNKAIKKVFIGADMACGRRKLDAQRIANYFTKNGYEIVTNPKKAEIIIVFTCSVTNVIDDLSLNYVKKFKEYDTELVVAGCLSAIQPKRLAQIFNGKTIVTEDLNQNPEKIDSLFPENKIKFRDIEDTNIVGVQNIEQGNRFEKIKKIVTSQHLGPSLILIMTVMMGSISDRIIRYILEKLFGEKPGLYYYHKLLNPPVYIIRLSWGCTGDCSYCGIKKAVGIHKSKPLDECVKEFKIGLEKGFTSFVLTGDDTGAYGN